MIAQDMNFQCLSVVFAIDYIISYIRLDNGIITEHISIDNKVTG